MSQKIAGFKLGVGLHDETGGRRDVIVVSTLSAAEQALLNAAPLNSLSLVSEEIIGTGPQSVYVKIQDTGTIVDDWEPLVRQSEMSTYVSNYITNNVTIPDYAFPKTKITETIVADTPTKIHDGVNIGGAGVGVAKFLVRMFNIAKESYSVFEVTAWYDYGDSSPSTVSIGQVIVHGNDGEINPAFSGEIAGGIMSLWVETDVAVALCNCTLFAWTGNNGWDYPLTSAMIYP